MTALPISAQWPQHWLICKCTDYFSNGIGRYVSSSQYTTISVSVGMLTSHVTLLGNTGRRLIIRITKLVYHRLYRSSAIHHQTQWVPSVFEYSQTMTQIIWSIFSDDHHRYLHCSAWITWSVDKHRHSDARPHQWNYHGQRSEGRLLDEWFTHLIAIG